MKVLHAKMHDIKMGTMQRGEHLLSVHEMIDDNENFLCLISKLKRKFFQHPCHLLETPMNIVCKYEIVNNLIPFNHI